MFLVGDVHVNSMYVDEIIKNVKEIILSKNEKNIVFMWDFVYHFNYDRKAILKIFDFIIELYNSGKNIYVLAWNHDWVSERFIWEESQKLLSNINNKDKNELLFISEPLFKIIEGEPILFFPYNYNITPLNKEETLKNIPYLDIKALEENEDKKVKVSLNINLRLYEEIEKYKQEYKKITIIHHYYFTETKFIWQRAVFQFKDIALSWKFLETENRFISWHLHTPFSTKNYLCTGSLYNSSVLENNMFKFLQIINFNKDNTPNIEYFPLSVNFYILIKHEKEQGKIGKIELIKYIQETFNNYCDPKILSNFWNTKINPLEIKEDFLKRTNLIIASDSINYDNIFEYFDDDLITLLKDYKIKKKKFVQISEEIQKLNLDNFNLNETLGDWKKLLQDYIWTKYPEEKEIYLDILRENNII